MEKALLHTDGSEITFVAGATKVNPKIWKLSYDWMTCYRQQSEDISYIVMEDLDLWPTLEKFLLELIN